MVTSLIIVGQRKKVALIDILKTLNMLHMQYTRVCYQDFTDVLVLA